MTSRTTGTWCGYDADDKIFGGELNCDHASQQAFQAEVVYDSLLNTRREALHAAAGYAIERLDQDGLVERAEEVVQYSREALQLTQCLDDHTIPPSSLAVGRDSSTSFPQRCDC